MTRRFPGWRDGRRVYPALAVAAVLLALTSVPANRARASSPAVHEVVIDAMAFSPGILRVKTGDRITWTNRDPFPHTVTAKDGAFDSGEIAAGASWTYQADKAGEFPYVCSLHPTMAAKLIVE